jgi:hypothetical protein
VQAGHERERRLKDRVESTLKPALLLFFLRPIALSAKGEAMHLLLRTSPLLLSLTLLACGGSTPPPNDAKSANDADQSTASNPQALEEERRGFMAECQEGPEYESFCACSWDSVTKTTTAEERQDLNNPNTKKALAALPKACGAKLPKQAVKSNFIKACAKSPDMAPFCECSYHFLDGKGMVTGGDADLSSVEGEMKAACSKELSVIARKAFIRGCMDNQTEAVCQCAYGALEKKYGKDKVLGLLEKGGDEAKNAVRSAGASCGAQ